MLKLYQRTRSLLISSVENKHLCGLEYDTVEYENTLQSSVVKICFLFKGFEGFKPNVQSTLKQND